MDIQAYNVTALSADELRNVGGGESVWYYLGFAVGFAYASLEAWGSGAAKWAEYANAGGTR